MEQCKDNGQDREQDKRTDRDKPADTDKERPRRPSSSGRRGLPDGFQVDVRAVAADVR